MKKWAFLYLEIWMSYLGFIFARLFQAQISEKTKSIAVFSNKKIVNHHTVYNSEMLIPVNTKAAVLKVKCKD